MVQDYDAFPLLDMDTPDFINALCHFNRRLPMSSITAEQALVVLRDAELLCTPEQIETALDRLAAAITRDWKAAIRWCWW